METSWNKIAPLPLSKLNEAKIELHRFVQLVAATGRSYYPSDSGDSHGTLLFDSGILKGKKLPNQQYFGLDIESFSLIHSGDARFSLENKSPNDGVLWVKEQLSAMNFNPDQYSLKLPYVIPDYGPDDLIAKPKERRYYQAFSQYYSNADFLLSQLKSTKYNNSDIICWPHHFDLATLKTLKSGTDPEESISIGIGFSPGDDTYNQPYFYLTPWPYPEPTKISGLELESGHWHTQGWIGAILTLEDIFESDSQEAITTHFINQAYHHLSNCLLKI